MIQQRIGVTAFLIFLVGIGAGAMLYTSYRLRDQQDLLNEGATPKTQYEKAQGNTITLTETRQGHRKWVLQMKELKYAKDNNAAKLTDIQGLVYGDKDDILFRFKAPTGEYLKDKGRIMLSKGAEAVSPSANVIITAPQMDWSSGNGMVNASGGVKMVKKDFGTSQSEKATFAMNFSKIQFLGNASTTIGSSNSQ
jgi:LPS export ABC transporter protein LptC